MIAVQYVGLAAFPALQDRGQINQIADCSRSLYYQRGEGKAAA